MRRVVETIEYTEMKAYTPHTSQILILISKIIMRSKRLLLQSDIGGYLCRMMAFLLQAVTLSPCHMASCYSMRWCDEW